ncbi:uncharacterized protein MYCFIDRAFT_174357 [Pseudocercospora fijiensis CIRAD86]|uniref:Uncharacterized protein n=1 Tax=Pseudocercospora fijiensis (strain CIRAD86) TaxID=383855 RepID=M3B077_PSEFD|nr:uncharacterized protein MYCFIDRAFT_174357 [Pseudocercospora fijiensis CIRAD86]EME82827.1 hypothetical protein MYCFIDRAFT_174357 [Pseudocercospora fijiensis CIRAD86]
MLLRYICLIEWNEQHDELRQSSNAYITGLRQTTSGRQNARWHKQQRVPSTSMRQRELRSDTTTALKFRGLELLGDSRRLLRTKDQAAHLWERKAPGVHVASWVGMSGETDVHRSFTSNAVHV